MEKRIIGIILILLGIAGLVVAGNKFVNGGGDDTKAIIMYFVLGVIFFFSGIALLKTTNSKPS
jgi:hypothetical protein